MIATAGPGSEGAGPRHGLSRRQAANGRKTNPMDEAGALTVAVLVVLAGPAAGSFAALLADRLPRGEPVVLTRSRCRGCGRRLGPVELVPILSWLWQRGRCRGCGAPLPGWLLQAELAGLGLGLGAALVAATPLQMLLGAGFLWCLLALALSDLRSYRLPDALTAALLALGLGLALAGDGVTPHGWPPLGWEGAPARLWAALVGAVAGAAVLGALALAYRRVRGRRGLGAGDIRLIAGIGAGVGPLALPLVTLIAALAGLTVAALRALRRGRRLRRGAPVPFGAFLAGAAGAVWLLSGGAAPAL